MQIRVLGSGDAFGTGGRFNTCLHLTSGSDSALLVDCGASGPLALNAASIDQNAISAILFSHFHGDHFGGLPFFVLNAHFVTGRTAPLLVAGPAGIEQRTRTVMEAMFPGSYDAKRKFEITFQEVTPEQPAVINGMDIAAFPMIHDDRAGPCQGYRFSREGKTFAFSGDTGWTDALLPLADEADVLLIECYSHNLKLENHLDWETLSARLPLLRARRILITHMGAGMLAHQEPLAVERAVDGMVISL